MKFLLASLCLAASLIVSGSGEITIAPVFSDHAVLQRDKPLPVWGRAEPGASVSVTFGAVSVSGTAGRDGRWVVKLPALAADSQPRTLTVSDGRDTVSVGDLLVGEVWLCSGQSNMQWPVKNTDNAAAEVAAAADPLLRLLNVPRVTSNVPSEDPGAKWELCTPLTVAEFSGVGYYFARELRRALGVPVGMMNASWGGTAAEPWISQALFRDHPNPKLARLHQWRAQAVRDTVEADRELLAECARQQAAWGEKFAVFLAANAGLPPPADDWKPLTVPAGNIEDTFGQRADGSYLVRKIFRLDRAPAGEVTLRLGAVRDFDITWLNGTRVGATVTISEPDPRETPRNVPRRYVVPAGVLRAGDNELLIRVFSYSGFCGLGQQEQARNIGLAAADGEEIPLAGAGWECRLEHNIGFCPPDFSVNRQAHAGMIRDGMIAPLAPYAMRGALWYQGEGNTRSAGDYREVLGLLIGDWRAAWGDDFSFYIAQLANYLARREQPADSDWARLREAQWQTALTVKDTGLAVLIDLGVANDIHPRNKQEVGRRLALIALARDYGRDIEYRGPAFSDMKIAGNRATLSFTHTGGGLASHGADGELRGFAIAGADRKFYWAKAVINGDTVTVSADEVPSPVAVRYAWADNPAADLYNADGLPASPFRTDDWARE
ncbi:MAG: hypothetical protein LBK60_08555 [Verrucomicrobiales bacterium]|jgi:sialate O-acetylesterase|nr:hypothetical protein [Verrucomicrobiales bacterium]